MDTEKEIIRGWLTLEKLPRVPAFSESIRYDNSGAYFCTPTLDMLIIVEEAEGNKK